MPDTKALDRVAGRAGELASQIEADRHLPADLVSDLAATGVFKLWVPPELGGAGADVAALLDAIETVSYHDGSTGWCVMIGGTTAINSGFLPSEAAREIYGPEGAITGGFGMPGGVGTLASDGLRVTGEWQWGSGTSHCTSIGGGIRIVDGDGRPAATADGASIAFVYLDPDHVELLDTWRVSGLKGTASTDYRCTDVAVADGRWVDMGPGRTPRHDAPLYRFSFMGALALGVSSVAIGLARRAVDELVALGAKTPAGSSRSLAERPAVQADLARAEAAAGSARAYAREIVEQCWSEACDIGEVSVDNRRLLRLAATNATVRSAEAVDLCYGAGGGSSIHDSHPLQRVFRDVHVATQHGMVATRMLEPLGRMAFGLETNTGTF